MNSIYHSFRSDTFTEGWTKTDWAINLLPFGGLACVAYEVGAACLCAKDQTAKIAQDFFKSPIQTSLKKIAQCVWVPTFICAALKIVSLIVTACWQRCYPPEVPTDPCKLPEDIIFEISSFLSLRELVNSSCVSKHWNECLSKPAIWQAAIYREMAFTSNHWTQLTKGIVRRVDFTKEYSTLPENIVDRLKCVHKAFPNKSISQTHLLVRMPRGLTINKLGKLAKEHFPGNADGYMYIWPEVIRTLGDKPCKKAAWLLMTKQEVQETRRKSYAEQSEIVANLAVKACVPYEVPTTLEAATCILAEYFRSKTRLFGRGAFDLIRCQEHFDGIPVTVGPFSPGGLIIAPYITYKGQNFIGVAVLYRF